MWEDYPGLSGLALNAITCIPIRGRQREIQDRMGEGNVTMNADTELM